MSYSDNNVTKYIHMAFQVFNVLLWHNKFSLVILKTQEIRQCQNICAFSPWTYFS